MFDLFLRILACLIGKQPFTIKPTKPQKFDSADLATWLFRELRSQTPRKPSFLNRFNPRQRALNALTYDHCREIILNCGVSCDSASRYSPQHYSPVFIDQIVDDLSSEKHKPVGVPLFIWLMLGKLAIELLIWWFTQQRQNQT